MVYCVLLSHGLTHINHHNKYIAKPDVFMVFCGENQRRNNQLWRASEDLVVSVNVGTPESRMDSLLCIHPMKMVDLGVPRWIANLDLGL